MRISAIFTVTSLAVALSGCGGFQGCGGADFGTANPDYAGTYTAGFYQTGGASPALPTPQISFALTVDASGQVAGTATDTATSQTTAVTGTLIDWFFPCQENQTQIALDYTFAAQSPSHLFGSRNRSVVVHWPFDSRIMRGNTQIHGTLLVDKN